MRCHKVRKEIKAYIDGELGRLMRWRVARHIASCAECRKEMEIMSELTSEVQNAGSIPAPDGLREKVMGELTFEPTNESSRRWPYKTSPFALAGVLFIIAAFAMILFPVFSRSRRGSPEGAINAPVMENKTAMPASSSDNAKQYTPHPNSVAKATANDDFDNPIKTAPAQSAPVQLMIIKTADLTVEVKKFQTASDSAISIAKSVGGYVTDSSAASEQSSPTEGTMTLRIPVSSFERTITRLSKLGKVKSRSVNGQDVTGEAVDLESRLRNKRAEERQYLDIMNRANRIPDVVTVTNELSRVRGEIEEAQGRLKYLKSTAAMSTINLTLAEKKIKPKPVAASPIGTIFHNALASLTNTGINLAGILIWLAVYSPFWALPLGVWMIRRRAAVVRE